MICFYYIFLEAIRHEVHVCAPKIVKYTYETIWFYMLHQYKLQLHVEYYFVQPQLLKYNMIRLTMFIFLVKITHISL